MIGASLLAALFPLHHCAMCNANSSFLGELRAALVATAFPLRAMCPAISSVLGMLRATIVAASFNLRAVCNANASLNGTIFAPLAAALFPLHHSAMCLANSSFLGMLRATIVAASLFRHPLLRMFVNHCGRCRAKTTRKIHACYRSKSESHRGVMRDLRQTYRRTRKMSYVVMNGLNQNYCVLVER
jgi:hypothetical protein